MILWFKLNWSSPGLYIKQLIIVLLLQIIFNEIIEWFEYNFDQYYRYFITLWNWVVRRFDGKKLDGLGFSLVCNIKKELLTYLQGL